MDKDEPEEGEIQDDDGLLEDVSSDEDTLPVCCGKSNENSCDKKYPISGTVETDFVSYSSRVHKRRPRRTCKRKSENFSSTAEGSKARLNVKYGEETNKTSNDYHVTLNSVVVDDHRTDDNFVNITSEYKSIRPKQSDKDEDTLQEKENRHDCQKESKVKRKCRRKRRHSNARIDSDVGNQKVCPRQEGKKEVTFTKFGTKSKSCHTKKRHVSPKREKHRYSKKKGGRKYWSWSRRLSDAVQKGSCTGNGVEGNSLLKRLQPMMTGNVSVTKEKTAVDIVKRKDEVSVELERGLKENPVPPPVAVKSDNGNNKGSSETADILKEANKNHLSQQSEDVVVLIDIEKPEPLVITIEDSDSELQASVGALEYESGEKINKEGEVKVTEGETSARETDEDEDLAQLRLLALQSNRRKVTSKPGVEDDEVLQLRLAALKSAVLKKCEVRKQRGVTLKSNKVKTMSSPPLPVLESSSTRDELGQETQKPEIISVKALQSEPDETTTLVDMELSHTDDESSAENEIITDPISADTRLPGDSAGTFLRVMHGDYSIQSVPCHNEPLLTAHEYKFVNCKQTQKEQDAVSTWNTTSSVYRSPELPSFDLEGCHLSGIYGSNVHTPQVGCSNCQLPFAPSSFQPQLQNELYQSNSISDLGCGDLEGVCSDPIISPLDSTVSPAVSRSFVSSDLNCQAIISDTVSGSRVEPQLISANLSVPITESNSLKMESVTSKVGILVSKAGSVAATDSHLFTLRTETETQKTDSFVYTQFCGMDSTTVSCQNWDRNMKRHASSRCIVPFKNSSFAAAVKTVGITDGPSTISSATAESFSPSLNCQDQELKSSEVGIVCQNHNVFVPTGDIVEKSDCNAEESSSEFENIDFSNMIVLDEVGRCSSPEAKIEDVSNEQVRSLNKGISQHHDQSSVSVDEDEEILRAKVLTTLVRKPSTSATYLVNKPNGTKDNKISVPYEVSSVQHIKTSTNLLSVVPQPTLPSCNLQVIHQTPVSREKGGTPSKLPGPFGRLKGSNKIALRSPSNKLQLSRQNLRNYIEANAIRGKFWKKSVKKGFSGMNIKQSSGHIKQLKEPAAVAINDAQSSAAELKTSCVHCKAVGNPIPRVVFCPRAPRPATLQVTVPTDYVRDEEHKRKITGSVVSSAASVLPQPPQRFVIHLGEDSDSPDEDGRTQQQPSEAPKRRCIITKNFSAPLLTRPPSRDSIVNSNSNISSSLLPQHSLSLSDKQNSSSVSTQPTPNSGIPVDFEKSLDIFLKEARKLQGATAKKAVTPGRYVGGKANPVALSITPLAVRHLPSSRQEEYHRLKKQIAVLEEQRKRSRQQHLSKNMSSTKSVSLPSSPGQDVSASGSDKPSLKIVLTTTNAEKREVLQNNVPSANVGNDGSAKMKVMQQYPTSHLQVFEEVKASDRDSLSIVAHGVAQTAPNKRSSHSFLADAVQVNSTQNDTGTTDTAVSLTLVSRKHQERTVMETTNSDSVMRKEEEPLINSQEPSPVKDSPHNVCDVHKQSSCKCDCLSSEGINCEEALEQKEAKLAEIEHQLLSKRYEVVDDLTRMATLLHQIERERTAEEECLSELRHTQEALRRIEERLAQQKELLSNMRNDISESHRHVAQGRAECISLSKNCLSLGISVKGRLYKVPAGGAEFMNLKLQQVAAQTRRLSRRKECSGDGDGSPSGSDVTALTCLQIPGQDKAEIRTACSVVEGSKDTLISYNVCASPTMAENAESDIIPIPCTEDADSKTDISQSKYTSSSEILGFSLSQQSFISSTPLSFSTENVAASKSDRCVQVSKDSETETWKEQDSVPAVTDVKQASMAVSEGLEMMELGVDCSSKETVVEHVAEYRSPLEHFHSKRGDSEAGVGVSGPLDPLAILCPYELMGSCQDEECSYQHHTKTTAT